VRGIRDRSRDRSNIADRGPNSEGRPESKETGHRSVVANLDPRTLSGGTKLKNRFPPLIVRATLTTFSAAPPTMRAHGGRTQESIFDLSLDPIVSLDPIAALIV
jgi:hypothetical protein